MWQGQTQAVEQHFLGFIWCRDAMESDDSVRQIGWATARFVERAATRSLHVGAYCPR